MSGYRWNPPKQQSDHATVIAMLRKENNRLKREILKLRNETVSNNTN